ncbi:hypothetical protein NEOLEDRAFT_1152464 [Neolentinus lepideus HHB14362 ss-1]|uniref:Uncharacterized protein n=1 Tax=Neolentinus lepideus HHB14362 ss-1 TaxID=1314782 RepID=A0A165MS72_9AGAM|nr:hypothetical protein NEOLEDRAFT_1152464 [Neolentinus lepideus HHB14362 ss-1]
MSVKYGTRTRQLHAEVRTQKHVYDLAQSDLEHCDDSRRVYVVKELITEPKIDAWLEETPSADVCTRCHTEAVEKVGAAISRLHSCPRQSDTRIGPALSRAPPAGGCTIDISTEPLLLCADDVTSNNFYIDPSFGKGPLVEEVARLIDLQRDKITLLGRVGVLIMMLGGRDLGIDEHGHKKRTRRSRRSRQSAARLTIPSSDTTPKIRSPLASS